MLGGKAVLYIHFMYYFGPFEAICQSYKPLIPKKPPNPSQTSREAKRLAFQGRSIERLRFRQEPQYHERLCEL